MSDVDPHRLSPAQQHALVVLLERYQDAGWIGSGYRHVRTNTLDSLQRLGLVETRWDYGRQVWRLLPAGQVAATELEEN